MDNIWIPVGDKVPCDIECVFVLLSNNHSDFNDGWYDIAFYDGTWNKRGGGILQDVVAWKELR